MKTKVLLYCTCCAILAGSFQIRADLLFHDDFDGTADTVITNYNSNYVYSESGSFTKTDIYDTIEAPGLTYSGLQSAGNAANVGVTVSGYSGTYYMYWTNRADVTPWTTQSDIYFSFLIQIPESTDMTENGRAGCWVRISNNRKIFVVVFWSGGSLYVGGNREGQNPAASVAYTPGTTVLIAGKVSSWAATGWQNPKVYVKVNPDPLNEEPDNADFDFSYDGGNQNSDPIKVTEAWLHVYKPNKSGARVFAYIDEFRVATTWAEALPTAASTPNGTFFMFR